MDLEPEDMVIVGDVERCFCNVERFAEAGLNHSSRGNERVNDALFGARSVSAKVGGGTLLCVPSL